MTLIIAESDRVERLAANKYEVSLERQNVKVWGPSLPPFATVKEKIGKTGKTVCNPSFSAIHVIKTTMIEGSRC